MQKMKFVHLINGNVLMQKISCTACHYRTDPDDFKFYSRAMVIRRLRRLGYVPMKDFVFEHRMAADVHNQLIASR